MAFLLKWIFCLFLALWSIFCYFCWCISVKQQKQDGGQSSSDLPAAVTSPPRSLPVTPPAAVISSPSEGTSKNSSPTKSSKTGPSSSKGKNHSASHFNQISQTIFFLANWPCEHLLIFIFFNQQERRQSQLAKLAPRREKGPHPLLALLPKLPKTPRRGPLHPKVNIISAHIFR